MKPIELQIFHHTDLTSVYSKASIEYTMDECETRLMTFYQINGISPWYENDKEYTEIHANGTCYICPLTYLETKKIIEG